MHPKAGFPCQPFSLAGAKQGMKDGRSNIIDHVVKSIDIGRPRAFVLENVEGLVTQHADVLKKILTDLGNIGRGEYKIKARMLNTRDHGVPQNRRRLFIIGIQSKFDTGSFQFPESIGHGGIQTILNPLQKNSAAALRTSFPPASQKTAQGNFLQTIKELMENGYQPFDVDVISDLDSTNVHWMEDVSPCLTSARAAAGGFWVTSRGRRFEWDEMMLLNAYPPKRIQPNISERQLMKMVGNGMSVNVLERLFYRLLPAAQLSKQSELHAQWESLDMAQKTLNTMRLRSA